MTVHVGDRRLVRHRKGGGSYLSAHDPRLLIGLGSAKQADLARLERNHDGVVLVATRPGSAAFTGEHANHRVEAGN